MKNYRITVNGKVYEVAVEEIGATSAPVAPVAAPVAPVAAPTPAPAAAPAPVAAPAAVGGTPVNSPMPGTILQVKVTAGQAVKKGETLFVLEAMKMENDIPAPCDGTIASINTQKGASVQAGDVLASIG